MSMLRQVTLSEPVHEPFQFKATVYFTLAADARDTCLNNVKQTSTGGNSNCDMALLLMPEVG